MDTVPEIWVYMSETLVQENEIFLLLDHNGRHHIPLFAVVARNMIKVDA